MKKIFITLCLVLLLSSNFSFSDNVATTESTTEVTTEATTEVSKEDQEKLNNMKKSDVHKFAEFNPNTGNSDVTLTEGMENLDRKLGMIWQMITFILTKYSKLVVIVISAFFLAMFFIFKHLKNKAAQKGAAILVVVPIIAYILYLYLSPFLDSLQ